MALQPPPPQIRELFGGAYKWLIKLLHDLSIVQTQSNTALYVSGLTTQNNTPSGGNIGWSACEIFYQGVAYLIAAGTTNAGQQYVIWNVGSNTFTAVNSYTPGPTVFPILTNNQGFADQTWNKIGAIAVQPAQMNQAAINIVGLVFTNNSPSPGNVSWTSCTIYYNGVAYPVAAGNTPSGQQYIIWDVGNGAFVSTSSYTPNATRFGIATNNGGIADLTWNKLGSFGIQPSHMNDATINIVGLVLTNNSPSAGNIAWSACTVVYNGISYSIPAGNTTSGHSFVTWTVGTSSFTEGNNYAPGSNVYAVATNNGGTADATWNKTGSIGIQAQHLYPVLTYDGPNGSLIISNVTFGDNTPIAGSCEWSACQATYQGITYSIPSGNSTSALPFIIWRLSSPSQFQAATAMPSNMGADDFVIGQNIASGSPATTGFFDRIYRFADRTGASTLVDETGVRGFNNKQLPTFTAQRQSADAVVGAAGTIAVYDGTGGGGNMAAALKGTANSQTAGVLFKRPSTVANLPASPVVGDTAMVTDATATAFASTVVGGGTNTVPVYWNGFNWLIG